MGSGAYWNAEKMFDLYLHDYMVKNNMHEAAATFKAEADVCSTPVVINTPDGFLHEWWSLFHDVYAATQSKHQEIKADASAVQAMQMKENEGQSKRPRMTHEATTKQFHKDTSSRQFTGDFGPNLNPLAVKNINISKSVATSSSQQRQQLPDHLQQQPQDNINGISLGRDVTVDPRLYVLHNATLSATGAQDAGTLAVNPGLLHGRPLKVIKSPRVGHRIFNSALQAPNHQQQIQNLTAEQHPLLGQNGRMRKTAPYLKVGGGPLDNMNANGDIPVEANAESFLSYGDDNAGSTSTPSRNSKPQATAYNKSEQKGFTFEEVGSLHSSESKLVCCHFSTEGNFLASAGHEKKVLIWNMETFDSVKTSEAHSLLITDVRFQPSSTFFATSSFDTTVKIWDAKRSSKPLCELVGHGEKVMSLDFHPIKENILCSCDRNNEVRLWNIVQCTSTHVFKGATRSVRFQPRFGKYLATSSGNSINVFDVETGKVDLSLKGSGHANDVVSLCWDTSGKYLASVGEDYARVWSTGANGKCIYELKSNGNKFQSCTFHPTDSLVLIIGGYQSLELWNPSESSKTLTVPAHKGLVAALAQSPKTEMVASVSHDQCVKLWK